MSKVFKHTDSFKPEKILPGNNETLPVWEDLAKPFKAPSSAPPIKKMPVEPVEDEDTPPPPSHETPTPSGTGQEPSFDTDFSAPTEPKETPAEEFQQAPVEPPVDVDKIAQESYDAGYQDGMKNMEDDYLSSTKALITACEEINLVRETILNNSMEEMQDLVFKIAEKILRFSVHEQDCTIVQTVKEAIRNAVKSDEFVIQVHPDDFAVINEKSTDFINTLSGLEHIIVKADPSVEQGGCIVESSNCTVDASIDIQLEMINNKLKDNN